MSNLNPIMKKEMEKEKEKENANESKNMPIYKLYWHCLLSFRRDWWDCLCSRKLQNGHWLCFYGAQGHVKEKLSLQWNFGWKHKTEAFGVQCNKTWCSWSGSGQAQVQYSCLCLPFLPVKSQSWFQSLKFTLGSSWFICWPATWISRLYPNNYTIFSIYLTFSGQYTASLPFA